MSTKPCIAKGHRECVRGFHRDHCRKCTMGTIACEMCDLDTAASLSCIYCLEGRRECSDCYGMGFVQRICQDCIKEHYRRQAGKGAFTKVKGQLSLAQRQFSRSMVSLSGTRSSSASSTSTSPASTFLTVLPRRGSVPDTGNESDDSDVSSSCCSASRSNSKSVISGRSFRFSAMSLLKIPLGLTSKSEHDGSKTHRRKWSWSSSLSTHSLPSTSMAA
ncbi:hypothetical protein BG011_004271 [Mortierella polycephala]|uniref:Uncharacterized protein n=1 Tax=Mortierella polycephala TaxID=41804 RepID=A0A9P6QCM2_9FUNG|nr:hypothetical protein BG011_004271 [Mortierella polycephala]